MKLGKIRFTSLILNSILEDEKLSKALFSEFYPTWIEQSEHMEDVFIYTGISPHFELIINSNIPFYTIEFNLNEYSIKFIKI